MDELGLELFIALKSQEQYFVINFLSEKQETPYSCIEKIGKQQTK